MGFEGHAGATRLRTEPNGTWTVSSLLFPKTANAGHVDSHNKATSIQSKATSRSTPGPNLAPARGRTCGTAHSMEQSGELQGRYLYWEDSAQCSFEIVKQESQGHFIFSQIVNGEASSGVLNRTEDHWNASVTGTSVRDWKLQLDGDALLVERSDGFEGRAERMIESKEWQAVVAQPVDPGETLLIKAAPGSGKSTLLREWCRGRPDNKILLLAFNTAVCQQLQANFNELANVTIQTIHKFARNATKHLHHGEIGEPTETDLKKFLKCSSEEVEKQQRLLAKVCASASVSMDFDGLVSLEDEDDEDTRKLQKSLWNHFSSGNCSFGVPHNVYLKLFQLSPDLRCKAFQEYDIVVVDEAQDCTDCMLHLVTSGQFARVLACDPHQNIYQFNKVNGKYLAKMEVDYRMSLPLSFRFGHEIAQLLTSIAQASPESVDSILEVQGNPKLETTLQVVQDPREAIKKLLAGNQKMTVLARKNRTLFLQAIDVIASLQEGKFDKFINFIGGFKAFKDKQLVPVLDLLYLRDGRQDEVTSKYVKKFDSLDNFRSRCEQQQSIDWLSKLCLCDRLLCPEQLQGLIESIEQFEAEGNGQADLVFSTVHQAKGLGFPNVVLLEDFLAEPTTEEYNIFYVASSRVSTGSLFVAESTMQALREGGKRRGRKRPLEESEEEDEAWNEEPEEEDLDPEEEDEGM